MNVLIIENSFFYSIGLNTYLKEMNDVITGKITIADSNSYLDHLDKSSFEMLLVDIYLFNSIDFNKQINELRIKNENLLVVVMCQGFQNCDIKTIILANCTAIIDKSMAKDQIKYIIKNIIPNKPNPDYSIIFKNFEKEQKIQNRLFKKYKLSNVLNKDYLLQYDLNEINNLNEKDVSLITIAI